MKYTAFLQRIYCKFAVYFIFTVYDRTQRKYVASRKVERQENNKYLLTLDNDPVVYHEGIKQVYALEWMIDK